MVSTAPRQAIKRDFVPYLREKGFALDMTLRFCRISPFYMVCSASRVADAIAKLPELFKRQPQ